MLIVVLSHKIGMKSNLIPNPRSCCLIQKTWIEKTSSSISYIVIFRLNIYEKIPGKTEFAPLFLILLVHELNNTPFFIII